ncbi:MAG TPA: hypothetical protein VFJ95_03330, partial [Gammaproteobacteria bacterium]|nr:hypothetical protein [Gammaproteobacteria bacterium]
MSAHPCVWCDRFAFHDSCQFRDRGMALEFACMRLDRARLRERRVSNHHAADVVALLAVELTDGDRILEIGTGALPRRRRGARHRWCQAPPVSGT